MQRPNVDRRRTPGRRFSRRVPVDEEKLKKHHRGSGVNVSRNSRIKNKFDKEKLRAKERNIRRTIEATARAELLLTEDYGCLEADAGEKTVQYNQKQIVDNVDITSAAKCFDLNLDFGPYCFRYTRNGRHLVLGGKKGHVAAFDWVTKKLACEINVMESVHDVCWLHSENMFAVAQKEWVYVYDNQGIELHCLKKMNVVNCLEFLPYHFLLASGSRDGYLSWLDVSIGEFVAKSNAKQGCISTMTQNPSNAVLCVGSSRGVVTMWSPTSKNPLAKMLCHSKPITSCVVHPNGTYMATTCPDRSVKVWDVRQLVGPVHNCILRSAANYLSYSQTGQLAMGMGNIVEIYRTNTSELQPYLKHKSRWPVNDLHFCPYEDVLGIGLSKGFSSILVPGSAEANYDALESNPFQTKSQRREAEVKALLDKIQPELISLDPYAIAEVDVPTLKEKVEAKHKLMYVKPKEIDFQPRRTKAKGKGGTAQVVRTVKILKEVRKREAIEAMKQASIEKHAKKSATPNKDYGVLNRFLPKSKKSSS